MQIDQLPRKGAFQLSLGLIVSVVFAVILLSLAIAWLTGMLGSIEELTHKTSDIAQQELLTRLASTGEKVGIAAPAVTDWAKGDTGSYALGIRNSETDTKKTYWINVYLESVGGDLTLTNIDQSKVNSWLSYSSALDLDAGGRDTVDIIIKPTADSKEGIYLFRAAVCDPDLGSDYGTCHTTSPDVGYTQASDSLYGHASFALEIKS